MTPPQYAEVETMVILVFSPLRVRGSTSQGDIWHGREEYTKIGVWFGMKTSQN